VLEMYSLRLRLVNRSCVLCRRQKRSVGEFARGVYNVTGKWTDKLDTDVRLDIERYWKDKLHDIDISTSNQASIFRA